MKRRRKGVTRVVVKGSAGAAVLAGGCWSVGAQETSQAGVVADGVDNRFQFAANLTCQICERWSASVFRAFGSDQSNIEPYAFRRNPVGIQTT